MLVEQMEQRLVSSSLDVQSAELDSSPFHYRVTPCFFTSRRLGRLRREAPCFYVIETYLSIHEQRILYGILNEKVSKLLAKPRINFSFAAPSTDLAEEGLECL
jgi:hypothetical protein